MSTWIKGLGIAATVLLLGAVAYYAIGVYQQAEPSIHTSGIVEGPEVNLAPKVAGKIAEICCNEGDRVQRDQVVIRLESDDLRAAVEQARAGVERAGAAIRVAESSVNAAKIAVDTAAAEIKTAQADVEKAQARRDDAAKKLARARALYDQKLLAQDALDTTTTADAAAAADFSSTQARLVEAQFKRDAAEAQLRTAEDQLLLARSDLKQSEASLAYNQAKFADTVIVTPISGTVVFKALEQGETVSPGVTVLTVVDVANLYVRADIDETLVDKIALGSEATIRTEGSPGTPFKGKVSEIGRYAEFATQRDMTRGRQDIKTFRVKVAVQDPGGRLKPGMTVDVEIAKGPAR